MSGSILVTYATTYGSTREVAEAVAETLRAAGLEVDIQPAWNMASARCFRAMWLPTDWSACTPVSRCVARPRDAVAVVTGRGLDRLAVPLPCLNHSQLLLRRD